ncbi:MAG: YitT family protein [Bacteroidota bacterium]
MQLTKLKNLTVEVVQIGFAIFLASIGLKAFLLPNGFLDGGATGIAILLSKIFHFKLSIILPIVSIPFFIIGFFTVTRKILIRSSVAIFSLSLVLYFENFQPITEDKLIIAIFGGIFLGTGIGLAIRNGAVLDGSEILGIYLNDKFGISIGTIILLFNIVLFGITALVLSPEIAMYSILTYIVTGKAIDFTIQGFENYVGLMIISNKSEELQNSFLDEIGQGITVYKGAKGYGKRGVTNNREIIHVIINRIDVRRINSMIDNIDTSAFVIEFDVNHVKGGKIRRYLSK